MAKSIRQATNLHQLQVPNGLGTDGAKDLPLRTGKVRSGDAVVQAIVKHVAAAVNHVTLSGSIGVATVGVGAAGTGANLDVTVTPKGTGHVIAASPVRLPSYDVDGAPSAVISEGALIFVSDGDAGDPCIAFSDGTDWLVLTSGVAIDDGA